MQLWLYARLHINHIRLATSSGALYWLQLLLLQILFKLNTAPLLPRTAAKNPSQYWLQILPEVWLYYRRGDVYCKHEQERQWAQTIRHFTENGADSDQNEVRHKRRAIEKKQHSEYTQQIARSLFVDGPVAFPFLGAGRTARSSFVVLRYELPSENTSHDCRYYNAYCQQESTNERGDPLQDTIPRRTAGENRWREHHRVACEWKKCVHHCNQRHGDQQYYGSLSSHEKLVLDWLGNEQISIKRDQSYDPKAVRHGKY